MEEKKQQSFEQNFQKLELLASALQDNKVSIDELVPKMKEALSAIRVCKDVLKKTKLQLQEVNAEFEELESENQS